MAMLIKPTTLAFSLLSLGALNLNAQDVPADIAAEESEQDVSAEFAPQGQLVPVAEDGIDNDMDDDLGGAEDFSVPEPTEVDALAREFSLFKQLMLDGVFDEADAVAKRVVELAISTKGQQSNEFAKALTNLAIVQHHTEQYDAAQQNFQAAIEIIEDIEDRLHAQLVNPLKGLGASQLESGRPDLAFSTFRRAVHVTHVNEGPHNLDQIDLLESIAETNLRMGDFDGAREIQDTIYALNFREYELDALALVPALMRRAAWQHRAGFVYDERASYRRAIRILEETKGKDDIELVKPLIMLGKSFFFVDTSGTQSYQGGRMASGEIYFRRAVRIADEHPDSDWQIVAQATLALGDYYMFENNLNRGNQMYGTAWELLSEDEERLDVRHQQLESIVPLRRLDLSQYVNATDAGSKPDNEDPFLQGKVTISYEISTRGRPIEIKMLEAEPPEFTAMQRHVQRQMRKRLYRPRFVEAEVVPTPDQRLEHTFFYRQSDLDSIRTAAESNKRK